MKFIGREEELKSLEESYIPKKASFIIIYGRKKFGETEFIKELFNKTVKLKLCDSILEYYNIRIKNKAAR